MRCCVAALAAHQLHVARVAALHALELVVHGVGLLEAAADLHARAHALQVCVCREGRLQPASALLERRSTTGAQALELRGDGLRLGGVEVGECAELQLRLEAPHVEAVRQRGEEVERFFAQPPARGGVQRVCEAQLEHSRGELYEDCPRVGAQGEDEGLGALPALGPAGRARAPEHGEEHGELADGLQQGERLLAHDGQDGLWTYVPPQHSQVQRPRGDGRPVHAQARKHLGHAHGLRHGLRVPARWALALVGHLERAEHTRALGGGQVVELGKQTCPEILHVPQLGGREAPALGRAEGEHALCGGREGRGRGERRAVRGGRACGAARAPPRVAHTPTHSQRVRWRGGGRGEGLHAQWRAGRVVRPPRRVRRRGSVRRRVTTAPACSAATSVAGQRHIRAHSQGS
mmetsp:Transcript_22424/g.60637  ORF Transcript_22424/g.60637 Transcript_22424/m.60637 type:complete len:405 (-) Transcript_22424:605-1819(-)